MKKSILAVSVLASFSLLAHDIGVEHEHVKDGWNAEAGFVSDVDVTSKLWNQRGKSDEEIAERVAFLVEAGQLDYSEEEIARNKAFARRFKDAVVINALLPSVPGIQRVTDEVFENALEENKEAGITAISGSVYAYPGVNDVSMEDTIDRADKVVDEMALVKADSTHDIRHAKRDDNMAVFYNTQGADFAIEDMRQVAANYKKGVRVMNFTYNNDNALAGGGQNPENNGVTALGKKFIEAANKSGVIVDCSHSSSQACIDAAEHSTKPIIASHSNVQGILPIGRNVSDEAIEAIASTEGAICTNGLGLFLHPDGDVSPEIIAEHVEYVGNLVGRDHTCYGSDKVHNYSEMLTIAMPRADLYPPEKGFGAPMKSASGADIWSIARVLESKYDWSEKDIRGFLGENLMRVYEANWG